ncbi:hypothetical protein ACFO0N_03050 [Halobium salinum]|uniref:Uncharacterized protein n=1 Tax=Halobium salinum TaxID=1364940 RepID=A0ABD5P8F0_9EURY|nr:hypothetical protein [Halobium salinum]
MRRAIATVFVCALLLLAGCSGTTDSAGNETGNASGAETTMDETTMNETTEAMDGGNETTTESNESAESDAEANFSFRSPAEGQVMVVHMGGASITNETTSEVVVSVGENNTTWVSDDANASAQEYPISVGNTITVNASAGDTVEVVWVSEDGTTETLATHEVEASNATTTTTAGNNSSANSTTGNATTANTTTTTAES